jgi:hypothetical protein
MLSVEIKCFATEMNSTSVLKKKLRAKSENNNFEIKNININDLINV